jgi:hypothetical protein
MMVFRTREVEGMRHRFTLLTLLWILLGCLTVGSVATAQEGSPPPGGFEIAPGVTAEALAFAPGSQVPSLYRLTFAPGVTYQAQSAPEISLGYLESGTLSLTVDAPVTVTRTDAAEIIPAGTDFTLSAGEYLVLPLLASGEVRNEGTEAASLLVASITPAMPAATPAT